MPEPVWGREAIDEEGRIVQGVLSLGYHGLNTTWQEVVRGQGLPEKPGRNLDLRAHVLGLDPDDTSFRGLSTIPGIGNSRTNRWPVEFAGENGLVFLIEGVLGWDTLFHTPKTTTGLDKAEAETAIMSRVALDRISGYGKVSFDRNQNEMVKPDDWKKNPWAAR